jgi:type III pantothenate kinase
MLLLIDAGNTRIKWAVVDDAQGDWLDAGILLHAELDKLATHLHAYPVTSALISNVAGAAVAAQLTQQLASCGAEPPALQWFQSASECAGVRNGYRQPQQLGSDRFASLIGARHLFPQEALLVVTCGTATTIDALKADGSFIGGMILPGLGTMAQSLALNTAQLPVAMPVNAVNAEHLFAGNTQDAIVNGCISAQVGAITRALAAHAPARCIISGGAAAYIAPHLPSPCKQVDNLVLIGLAASLNVIQQEYKST